MEHRWRNQLGTLADVNEGRPMNLTSEARLELWAERLDREPQRCLSTLGEIELAPLASVCACALIIHRSRSPLRILYFVQSA